MQGLKNSVNDRGLRAGGRVTMGKKMKNKGVRRDGEERRERDSRTPFTKPTNSESLGRVCECVVTAHPTLLTLEIHRG